MGPIKFSISKHPTLYKHFCSLLHTHLENSECSGLYLNISKLWNHHNTYMCSGASLTQAPFQLLAFSNPQITSLNVDTTLDLLCIMYACHLKFRFNFSFKIYFISKLSYIVYIPSLPIKPEKIHITCLKC